MSDPALACVEVTSIARGVLLLDIMVKRAAVRLVHHGRHSNGKYIILISGQVADVEEAHRAALDASSGVILGEVMLPAAHDLLVSALNGNSATPGPDAILLVELLHVWSALEALDTVLKYVDATVVDLHLAAGIGGKGYFVIQGELYDMEAAQEAIAGRFASEIIEMILIARPHEDMLSAVGHRSPFASDHR
jgi:microcompartment protein CcmL/EutN